MPRVRAAARLFALVNAPRHPTTSPWPRRLAWAAWAAAIPLVFFGGSVTSLHAGLAIEGWMIVDPGKGDWFLPLYPLDRWTRSLGTFVEHSHRLFGMLVGLLAIASVVMTLVAERRNLPRALVPAALVAVIVQGVLGGLRVLERSTDLAFLHGALGQAVFVLLGAAALSLAPRRDAIPSAAQASNARLKRVAVGASAVVYLQIVIGAWLRHGQSMIALAAHVVVLLGAIAAVTMLAHALKRAEEHAPDAQGLARHRKALWIVLWAQLLLGLLAFTWVYVVVGRDRQATELHQSFFPTMHVLGGAALFFACVAAWLRASTRAAGSGEVRVERSTDLASPANGVGAAR